MYWNYIFSIRVTDLVVKHRFPCYILRVLHRYLFLRRYVCVKKNAK